MGKKKNLEVKLPITEEKTLLHLTNAYGLICKYREAQKAPQVSFESWVSGVLIEGANAIYRFHGENLKRIKSQETPPESASESENNND